MSYWRYYGGNTIDGRCDSAWIWGGSTQADEKLDRGLVALRCSDESVYLGWRMLASDPDNVMFHVYRRSAGAAAKRLTSVPVRKSTGVGDLAPELKQKNNSLAWPKLAPVYDNAWETIIKTKSP